MPITKTYALESPYSLIEIKPSKVHGRGVFAKYYISKGQKIRCEVIQVSDVIEASTSLGDYVFPFEGRRAKCICIGFGSFFNHSDEPNMKIHELDKENLTKTFIALKDIMPGQELFIYYNDTFSSKLKSNGKG